MSHTTKPHLPKEETVEEIGNSLSDANKAEVESMGHASHSKEAKPKAVAKGVQDGFCKLYNLEKCSQIEMDALRTAEKLVAAGPEVAIAALLLGKLNLPEPAKHEKH